MVLMGFSWPMLDSMVPTITAARSILSLAVMPVIVSFARDFQRQNMSAVLFLPSVGPVAIDDSGSHIFPLEARSIGAVSLKGS
jgi:hypothetical protein